MSGQELRNLAEQAGLGPVDICHEAKVSDTTLSKVYKDEHVRATTRVRVEQAIRRLSSKMKAAVAG